MAPPTAPAALRRASNKAAHDDHRRGKLWTAMRILRRFTASELCAVAECDSRGAALAFLNQLRHAGYTRNSRNGNEEAVWALTRNTGPLCPAVLKNRTVVWDHNTRQEYPIR